MATVRFFTRGSSDSQTIYLRLRDGRNIDFSASTGITIHPKHWSAAKGWISLKADFHNKLNVEHHLNTLTNSILGERNKQVANGLPVSREWLDGILLKIQGKETDAVKDRLIYLIEQYRDDLPNKVRKGKRGVTPESMRNYSTTVSRLKKFEEKQKRIFRGIEIDLTFHRKYIKFASEDLGLALNSIGRDIKVIKTVCLDAKDSGISVHDHALSRNFSPPSEKTIINTLNIAELEKVKSFSGANYLENARDWLLIGCWTGCRVGDLMNLTMDNVIDYLDGDKIIQYTQSKTGKLVNVPMHPEVAEILLRLDGFPRPISAVKFNDYIKLVCKKAGLTYQEYGSRRNPESHLKENGLFEKWELIKSHTCRRSFATNHYNKLTNKQIMAVTGHSTEKMLLAYIGETEVDHVDDFFNLWKTEKPQTIKQA